MYKNAGHLRKPTVFLFTEAEIKDEVRCCHVRHHQLANQPFLDTREELACSTKLVAMAAERPRFMLGRRYHVVLLRPRASKSHLLWLVPFHVDVVEISSPSKVFLEVMNSVLMTGEIPGLFAKDEMMAMTADLRNSFLKVCLQAMGIIFACSCVRCYCSLLNNPQKRSFVECDPCSREWNSPVLLLGSTQ